MMLLPRTPDAGLPDDSSVEFFRVFLVEKHAPTGLRRTLSFGLIFILVVYYLQYIQLDHGSLSTLSASEKSCSEDESREDVTTLKLQNL